MGHGRSRDKLLLLLDIWLVGQMHRITSLCIDSRTVYTSVERLFFDICHFV